MIDVLRLVLSTRFMFESFVHCEKRSGKDEARELSSRSPQVCTSFVFTNTNKHQKAPQRKSVDEMRELAAAC